MRNFARRGTAGGGTANTTTWITMTGIILAKADRTGTNGATTMATHHRRHPHPLLRSDGGVK